MSMKLRRKTRISYYEPDEPAPDEYIFCEECIDFVYEYCSIHGYLLVIPDTEMTNASSSLVPAAASSIPGDFLHLAPSSIPGAGIGVYSTMTLPRGLRFGPYKGEITHHISSDYCWQLYDRNNRPSHVVDAADADKSNWMRYVNCSRHWTEQNLIAYQYMGQLYYRTIKIIPKFRELLVFYGSEFAHHLGINLKRYNDPCFFYTHHLDGQATQENCNINAYEIRNITKNAEDGCFNTEIIEIDDKDDKTVFEGNKLKEIASNIETFICDTCNKKFTTKEAIIKHFGTNKNCNVVLKENYACQKCSFSTIYEEYFKKHLRFHNEDRKYVCDSCGHRFAKEKNLKMHTKQRTLNGKTSECFTEYLTEVKKPQFHKCGVCGYKTLYRHRLKMHVETHSEEKPFCCQFCDYRGRRNNTLKRHIQNVHTKNKI